MTLQCPFDLIMTLLHHVSHGQEWHGSLPSRIKVKPCSYFLPYTLWHCYYTGGDWTNLCRVAYELLWIRIFFFLVSSGVISSVEWKLLANYLASDQKLVFHGNPYIFLFLTSFSVAKTQSNRWKQPLINRRTLVVYDRSVGCGIVTSWKYLLWRYFDWLSLECF